jgi:hypothetical protein
MYLWRMGSKKSTLGRLARKRIETARLELSAAEQVAL